MTLCVSESCHQEIDPSWSFCPTCGADNRPPEDRPKVKQCQHEFASDNCYCVRCGRHSLKRRDNEIATPRLRSLPAAILGGLVIILACLLQLIHERGKGSLSSWVHSWYDFTYTTAGKYGQPVYTERGAYILTGIIFVGGLIFAFGLSKTTFDD